MPPTFVALVLMVITGVMFLTALVVAFVRLRSSRQAFVIACTFTAGALGGAASGIGGALLASTLGEPQEMPHAGLLLLLVVGGAAGGAVLALYALSKVSKYPPWRRY